MTKKILVIYHSADWDGMFSGFIAESYLKSVENADVDMLPLNYGQTIDIDLSIYDETVIMDFSLPDEMMVEYSDRIVWIDHHALSISRLTFTHQFRGIQDTSGKYSAAYLAWKYFYEDRLCPKCVLAVSAYDTFNKSGEYISWDEALKYQSYLRTYGLSTDTARQEILAEPMSNSYQFYEALGIGEAVLRKAALDEDRAFSQNAFPVACGEHMGLCLFTTDMSSMACVNHLENEAVDFILLVNRLGVGRYKMSVRVGEHSDFNAAEFASHHNGGGHLKAAGGVLSQKEVINLMKYSTIQP